MNNWRKNWNPKAESSKGNQSGSLKSNDLGHAQRIGAETNLEYNAPKSRRGLEQTVMYAELMGNHKN